MSPDRAADTRGRAADLMVIGAHMFDAEAMAGGTCATVASGGGRVVLVHLSDGEQGHASLPPAVYAAQKRGEATQAATLLGAEHVALHLPDTRVTVTDEVSGQVALLIREARPRTVIGHWRGSWHRDHRAAHQALMDGLFLAALPTYVPDQAAWLPPRVLFAENWEDAEGFEPSTYLDITPGYDRWLEAMDAYELCRTDVASFPYRDYYLSLARLRGCLSGYRYAEAFMALSRPVAAGLGIFHPEDESA
jgi:LmbE family N-acetylglucosaminyl deacetylase